MEAENAEKARHAYGHLDERPRLENIETTRNLDMDEDILEVTSLPVMQASRDRMLRMLNCYVSDDDGDLPHAEFLKQVADRIQDDLYAGFVRDIDSK
jgi:hypothetical protein